MGLAQGHGGPQRRESAKTERLGIAIVQLVVTDELGWLFREQPVSDYGIDAHIEIVDDGAPTGKLIAVQIRSGARYFAEETQDGFIFRGKQEHLDYWLRHSLPVVVILCDPRRRVCYWQSVDEDNIARTKTGWKMLVPTRQILNASAIALLSRVAAGSPYQHRLRQLQLAKPLMLRIQQGERLLLEAEEWINKSMSRGSMRVLIEAQDGTVTTAFDWPFVMFPHLPWAYVFPHLFPWAEFDIDDETYYDIESDDYRESEGFWDNEEQRYLLVSPDDFQEWRARLPRIRPYKIEQGEIAHFRLELSLNSVGRSFLETDRFLATGTVDEAPHDLSYGEYARSLKMMALRRRGLADIEFGSNKAPQQARRHITKQRRRK